MSHGFQSLPGYSCSGCREECRGYRHCRIFCFSLVYSFYTSYSVLARDCQLDWNILRSSRKLSVACILPSVSASDIKTWPHSGHRRASSAKRLPRYVKRTSAGSRPQPHLLHLSFLLSAVCTLYFICFSDAIPDRLQFYL